MSDIKEKVMDTLKNVDKAEIKKAVDSALDSGAADKVIDAAEKKLNKDIDKNDIKSGLDKLLK